MTMTDLLRVAGNHDLGHPPSLQERRMPQPKNLSYKQLRDYGVPYGRQHLLRLEKRGEFPKRVTFGARCVRWVESEIVSWVLVHVAQRGPHAPSPKKRERGTPRSQKAGEVPC